MEKFRAKVITLESVTPEIQKRIDARNIKFQPFIGADFETYQHPIKVSVLNEHVQSIVKWFEAKECKVKSIEPIFRGRDYTFVTRTRYNVTVGIDSLRWHIERYTSNYELDFDPPFQRGYVWHDWQKKAYVEYLISGGVSGREIYFNAPHWMGDVPEVKMVIVDGKQRISALLDFIDGKFSIFEGAFFNDLRYEDKGQLTLNFNVNDITDYKDVVRWYISMNTGGSMHTEDDIAKAKEELNK